MLPFNYLAPPDSKRQRYLDLDCGYYWSLKLGNDGRPNGGHSRPVLESKIAATLLARASTTLTVALAVAVVRRQALRKFDDDNCGHQSEWRAGHSL